MFTAMFGHRSSKQINERARLALLKLKTMHPKDDPEKKQEKRTDKNFKIRPPGEHLGSSNAFEETENPLSRDADDISDEKLDEMLDE